MFRLLGTGSRQDQPGYNRQCLTKCSSVSGICVKKGANKTCSKKLNMVKLSEQRLLIYQFLFKFFLFVSTRTYKIKMVLNEKKRTSCFNVKRCRYIVSYSFVYFGLEKTPKPKPIVFVRHLIFLQIYLLN